jgi:hypothetical protein
MRESLAHSSRAVHKISAMMHRRAVKLFLFRSTGQHVLRKIPDSDFKSFWLGFGISLPNCRHEGRRRRHAS